MVHIFIINSASADKDLSKMIREHLASRDDIKYFVFNTIEAGQEKDIASRMVRYFHGEKIRIYSCGGSGTIHNIVNAIEDFSTVEVAYFPCGMTNDFIKAFGDYKKLFLDLDELIDGKAVPIDYIKTNHGICINTFSLGADATMIRMMNNLRVFDIFGSQMPYNLSMIIGVLTSSPRRMILNIDDSEITRDFSEIILANGCTLGGSLTITQKPVINDKKVAYVYTYDRKGFRLLSCLFALMKADYRGICNTSEIGTASSFELCSVDGKPIAANLDGEYVVGGRYWKIEVIEKGLNFVMPKSFDLERYYAETEVARNESLY